jgi:hypothetical protein
MKVIRQSRRDDEPAGRALFAWSFSETRRVSTLPAIDKYVNRKLRRWTRDKHQRRDRAFWRTPPRNSQTTSTPLLKMDCNASDFALVAN